MSGYEQLDAFKCALALMVEVYRVTALFPRREMYGLTSQMRRASLSVMSHIAEGKGRLTIGEYRQFLSQARGSLFEVEAQAIGAHELRFLDDENYELLRKSIRKAARPLHGLILWARRQEASGRGRVPQEDDLAS